MTMDHAAAHERIEDLLLEPARLAELPGSMHPDDQALRAHLAGCPTCRADLESWERVQRRVADALPADAGHAAIATSPIELPPSLRASALAATRRVDRTPAPISIARVRSRRAVATWVGLAASLVVLAGTAVIAADQVARRSAAEVELRSLSSALGAVDRVLAASSRKVVPLNTAIGSPAGSISWSRHDWVVLTTALDTPARDQEYRCWLENDGRSVPIGVMDFAGDTAYWVASVDEWATWEIGPDTRFVVTLESRGAAERTGVTLLSADLGS